MRASIAKPNVECGSLLPLSPFYLKVNRRKKRPRKRIPARPRGINGRSLLFVWPVRFRLWLGFWPRFIRCRLLGCALFAGLRLRN
jgi:hypothetical protein